MVKAIVLLFVAGGVLYFVFYPFLKNKINRKKTLRWFLFLYGGALLISTIGYYFTGTDKPDSFKQGVELIKEQEAVKSRIGQFKALNFEEDDLPGKADNPADLKFTLRGSKASLLLEAKVAKDGDGNWYLIRIEKDSLLKKH
ncbi:YwiC-like family protein [Pontibacter sp. E15-1]|uniref:YwiC-like family protein n=1 Tax=Pontibacter sp. E15-1 TaxID=2919918 RepID=UPI001F4F6D0A|nr:YwiC-like family protein [Pontibacter sp. E15-1]MCJ8165217.1 YwiC-like family protein [Pontibacter sp. E15-1]